MGYQIAIDDLGAGHSSLAALALLRPDVVKLDMSFVRGVDRDRTRQKLVRTMARLCDDLEVAFVTEGVENHGELEALLVLGCDVFQGWHFAMPGAAFPIVDWRTHDAT